MLLWDSQRPDHGTGRKQAITTALLYRPSWFHAREGTQAWPWGWRHPLPQLLSPAVPIGGCVSYRSEEEVENTWAPSQGSPTPEPPSQHGTMWLSHLHCTLAPSPSPVIAGLLVQLVESTWRGSLSGERGSALTLRSPVDGQVT